MCSLVQLSHAEYFGVLSQSQRNENVHKAIPHWRFVKVAASDCGQCNLHGPGGFYSKESCSMLYVLNPPQLTATTTSTSTSTPLMRCTRTILLLFLSVVTTSALPVRKSIRFGVHALHRARGQDRATNTVNVLRIARIVRMNRHSNSLSR